MDNRQLYPDFLRAGSLARIIVFHFVGWQALTYFPSLGIMFALAGWFVAKSLNNDSAPTVLYHRLVRLLPTWWTFALLTLIGGFFYAKGAGIDLQPTLAWLFPYQQVTWGLDNAYANDATVVTWYIAAYLWLLMLSPVLLYVYKKLSWLAVFAPVIAMPIYTWYFPYQDTVLGETFYNVLMFGGCWMLGFVKADNAINNVPRYLIWTTAIVCTACGIFLTYDELSLASNPVAQSVMSFGIAMLLISFNPDLTKFPSWIKAVVRSFNTFAVTIYLFHNILVDLAYKVGDYIGMYDVGNHIGMHNYGGEVGNFLCFVILLGLLYLTTKTIGIVETHKWIKR